MDNKNFKKAFIAFNKVIDQFIDNLIKTVPDNTDIKAFKSKLEQLRFSQPQFSKEIIKKFASKLVKYESHIHNKNEKFFTDELKINNSYLADAIKIKELWKTNLSDKNKEVVWKYFSTMVKLAKLIS